MTSPVSGISAYALSTVPSTATAPTTAGVGATAGSGSSGTSSAGGLSLDPQAFLQLLVAQLQYQDPSNPVDTSTFMNQTATLSQVQSMNSMSATLTALVGAQQAQAATQLVGRTVTYTDPSGAQATGVVSSASLLATGPTLQIGSATVPLGSVVGVSTPAPAATPTA